MAQSARLEFKENLLGRGAGRVPFLWIGISILVLIAFFGFAIVSLGYIFRSLNLLVCGLLFLALVFFAVWLMSGYIRDEALVALEKILDNLLESGSQSKRVYYPDGDSLVGGVIFRLNQLLDERDNKLKAQRRFVGSVSHEIRTPLTILKGDIEVALLKRRESEEYERILRSNLEEVDRIGKLVEDLLTLARADSGELVLRPQKVDLDALVTELGKFYRERAMEEGIEVSYDVEPNVEIMGDEQRLRQLVANLVENAIQYTPKGGRIEIVLWKDGQEVEIRIKDSGIGIPSSELPHIFEPFYRGSSAKEARKMGYGLGLAICRYIAEAHRGRIEVESRVGPGSGTVFTLRLPIRD